MNIFGLILLLACTPTALLDFVMPKWTADDSVRIEDSYKYIYQATRGGEHAAPDRASATAWLDNEWRTLSEEPKHENEWDLLCPGGEIGRLNLRPFKKSLGDRELLLSAFLASAREYNSEPETFTDAWNELGKRLKKKSVGKLTHKAWKELDAEMKKKSYPAVHHSETYNAARRPAYRILTEDNYRRLMSAQMLTTPRD